MTSDAHETGLAAIGRLDVAAAFSTQQASSRHIRTALEPDQQEPLILSGGGEIVHPPGVELRALGSTLLSVLFNAASLMVEQAEQDPSPRQI